VEESVSFRRWIHFSEASVFEISRNNVMLKTDASVGLSKFYEVCVLQLNNNFEEEDVWMEATDDELDALEIEEVMEQFSTDMSDTIH
jgi:mevalonate pyrophosphate decarboxylase